VTPRVVRTVLPLAGVLLAVLAVLVGSLPVAARVVLGLPGVLIAPGYAIVLAAWPPRRLTGEIRGVLTLGASLSVAVLVGLATAALPVGLSAGSVVTGLAVVTVAAVGVYLRRDVGLTDTTPSRARWRPRVTPGSIALVAAGAIAIGSVVVANHGATTADRKVQFTQLYLQPASNHPTAIQVGIQSFESDPTTFRLVLVDSVNDQTLLTVPAIRLTRTQTIEETLDLPSGVARAELRVDLYRAGQDAAYRSVTVG
jgi:hypothetical protein